MVTPYDRLFAYKNKLLFGFGRVGCLRVWNIKDLENISEVNLTYRKIEVSMQSIYDFSSDENESGESSS